ncbi:hypothetical protein [Tenacibaculum insulae]|uniref:hypothetical protein n=1 Tax=Tenacibaculum insulae TaxID=2029677 RepID=UPI003AB15D2D
MIKYKKIRGHNRIQKEIEKWKNNNLNLNIEYLESYKREYCKVWVSPFSDISVSRAENPSPKNKNRKLIIKSLLDIYNSWEKQLKALNKPYYLTIWLFEQDVAKSQIVCAIDDYIDFYKTTFYRPEKQRKMPVKNYGKFKAQLTDFNWIYAHDENYFTKEDVEMEIDDYLTLADYSSSKKWYKKKLKENPRSYTDGFGNTTYYTKKGVIWIGTKNVIIDDLN